MRKSKKTKTLRAKIKTKKRSDEYSALSRSATNAEIETKEASKHLQFISSTLSCESMNKALCDFNFEKYLISKQRLPYFNFLQSYHTLLRSVLYSHNIIGHTNLIIWNVMKILYTTITGCHNSIWHIFSATKKHVIVFKSFTLYKNYHSLCKVFFMG